MVSINSSIMYSRWRRSSSSIYPSDIQSQSIITALNHKCSIKTSNLTLDRWLSLFLCLLLFQQCSAYTRQSATPDTKACCRSKGVSDYCMEKMCDTSQPPDEFDVFEVANVCTRYLSPIAQCLSDGRNHTKCCRSNAKGADDLCMHLCDGTPHSFNASTWEEYKGYVACLTFNVQSIFTCFDRGYEIGPGPPNRLEVIRTTSTTVRLKWASPSILPHKVVKYSIFYAVNLDQTKRYPGWALSYQRVDTDDESKFYELDRLIPDTRYQLYVVARGRDEDVVSLQSNIVEFVTDGVASRVEAFKSKVDAPLTLPTTLICLVNTRGGGERENVNVIWYYGRNQRDFSTVPLNNQAKYQQTTRLMPELINPMEHSSIEVTTKRVYVASLTISRVSHSDLGLYRCTAKTPFGDSSATVELIQSSALRVPQSPPNVTECCIKEGVQPKCVAACQNNMEDQPTISLFQGSTSCGQDFPKILRCAVGSGEQQQKERAFCCLRRGVPLSCLFLCDSTRSMASNQMDSLSCVQYTNELLQCSIETKQYLPSPPTDLRVKQSTGDSVTIEWTQEPTPIDIVAFHIFYKKTNEQNWRKITSGSMTVVLADLSRNAQYTVLAVSANAAGTSDPSRALNFTTGGRARDQSMVGSRRRKSRNNARHNSNNHHHHHVQSSAGPSE